MSNALLSTQYGAVRLLLNVHVRLVAYRLRGPASLPVGTRRPRGLPVLVHVVSRRARVLRLRRTDRPLASSRDQPYCLLPSIQNQRSWFSDFRSSIARPTDTHVYASTNTSRRSPQDSGPRWSRSSFPVGLLHSLQHAGLSRRTLKPARIDSQSGYRYYSASQLPRLHRILALRDFGFPPDQIAGALEEGVTAETLRGMLMLRQAERGVCAEGNGTARSVESASAFD